MRILHVREAPGVPGASGLDAATLADHGMLGMVHFRLGPGEEIPGHVMPMEVVFLVMEGEGFLKVDREECAAGCGTVLRCSAGTTRAWENRGTLPLRVLVLKLKASTETGDEVMDIRRIEEQPAAENAHGVDVRRAYESEHALASVITLKPGQALKRHITPVDVFFYVLEGSGTVDVGEESMTVSKDTVIDSPKDVPHCWRNEGGDVLRVLVVKVPKPTKGTRLL